MNNVYSVDDAYTLIERIWRQGVKENLTRIPYDEIPRGVFTDFSMILQDLMNLFSERYAVWTKGCQFGPWDYTLYGLLLFLDNKYDRIITEEKVTNLFVLAFVVFEQLGIIKTKNRGEKKMSQYLADASHNPIPEVMDYFQQKLDSIIEEAEEGQILDAKYTSEDATRLYAEFSNAKPTYALTTHAALIGYNRKHEKDIYVLCELMNFLSTKYYHWIQDHFNERDVYDGTILGFQNMLPADRNSIGRIVDCIEILYRAGVIDYNPLVIDNSGTVLEQISQKLTHKKITTYILFREGPLIEHFKK